VNELGLQRFINLQTNIVDKRDNGRMNVILKRLCVTIVAMESKKYCIF
jgi:hypothetical protein